MYLSLKPEASSRWSFHTDKNLGELILIKQWKVGQGQEEWIQALLLCFGHLLQRLQNLNLNLINAFKDTALAAVMYTNVTTISRCQQKPLNMKVDS